jgi:deoxycytidine triphosphate deaminase
MKRVKSLFHMVSQALAMMSAVPNEFKVFTNIHSATVDPKVFDDNSFVDITSDVCIIPSKLFCAR